MTTTAVDDAPAVGRNDDFRRRLLDGLAASIEERGYRDTTVATSSGMPGPPSAPSTASSPLKRTASPSCSLPTTTNSSRPSALPSTRRPPLA